MPVVGICRHGRDNDYLFVAQDEPKPGHLFNVSFYRMANFGYGCAFRSQFPTAFLACEDRVLTACDGTVFAGDDLIRTFAISKGVYDGIFNHSNDSPRREDIEYHRALDAAIKEGFNEPVVNGRPVAASSAIDITDLV